MRLVKTVSVKICYHVKWLYWSIWFSSKYSICVYKQIIDFRRKQQLLDRLRNTCNANVDRSQDLQLFPIGIILCPSPGNDLFVCKKSSLLMIHWLCSRLHVIEPQINKLSRVQNNSVESIYPEHFNKQNNWKPLANSTQKHQNLLKQRTESINCFQYVYLLALSTGCENIGTHQSQGFVASYCRWHHFTLWFMSALWLFTWKIYVKYKLCLHYCGHKNKNFRGTISNRIV